MAAPARDVRPLSEHASSFVEAPESSRNSHDVESTPHSLSRAVYERRAEYTRPHTMKIKIGTWNVAACPGVENDIKGWFVDGKGVDTVLASVKIADPSQDNIEIVPGKETSMPQSTSNLNLGDEGAVIGGKDIGIYVLGLQEIVTLASAKEYISRVYVDSGPIKKWKDTLADAVPAGYELVADTQMSGLLLLIYASPSIAPTISSVSSVSVGTGIMGYLGNKGAVSTRIVLGETTRLVFINSHLASGVDKAHLERRCWDFNQIASRTRFDPINHAGVLEDTQEGIGEEDFAFWFGDLNFRLDGLPGEDIRRLLMLHTKGEYALGSKVRSGLEDEILKSEEPIKVHHVESDDDEPSGSSSASLEEDSATNLPDPEDFVQDPHADPTSLQATLDSLLPHDQLRRVQRHKKAFHDGWREGPINFLPTYKYDVGSLCMFDSSEKLRPPSWCDRILFRTHRDKLEYEEKSQEEELARLKDEEMRLRGIAEAAQAEEVIFDYDPESDGVDSFGDYDEYDEGEDETEEVITKEGYVDSLHLDVYTSHQRILSSDHKPVDAVFTIHYDAVVPELKSKVHQEVAKELDREENEHRPTITILVDHSAVLGGSAAGSPATANSAEGINFGNVRYLCRKERALTIANTGQVLAEFAFVGKTSDPEQPGQVSPSWLQVAFVDSDDDGEAKSLPEKVTLEPGDTAMVTLEVYVQDTAQARALNMSDLQLDEVLVLRVTDGRDYFIPLKGTWMQSCFGRSIDELIRIPEGGVRALLPPGHVRGEVNRGQEVCWSAPRELFKLTEEIELLIERAIADRDMVHEFQGPVGDGWPFEPTTEAEKREELRQYLLEALDSDKNLRDSFPPEVQAVEKLETISEVLILFLGSITDGVVPPALWDKVEHEMTTRKQPTNAEETRMLTLDALSSSPNHSISLVFLMAMLGKVITELAPVPRSTVSSIADSKRNRMSFRQSMGYGKSWGSVSITEDPALAKRQAIQRRLAEIFAPVVIRGPGTLVEKDRKSGEQKKKEIIEAFLAKE